MEFRRRDVRREASVKHLIVPYPRIPCCHPREDCHRWWCCFQNAEGKPRIIHIVISTSYMVHRDYRNGWMRSTRYI